MDAFIAGTAPGWAELHFRYFPPLISVLKEIPGTRWNPARKAWTIPEHGLAVLPSLLAARRVPVTLKRTANATYPPTTLHPALAQRLRDYQRKGAELSVSNPGFLLTFEMRVGKTPTAVVAAASMLADGRINTVLILYPNSVRDEWVRQFPAWSGGLEVVPLRSQALPAFDDLVKAQHLALGIHYELLSSKTFAGTEEVPGLLQRVLEARGGRFMIIADEVQNLKNRKAGRTKVASKLARLPGCGWRLGLTGTPMRNRARDMFGMFDFIYPDSMGGYWTYAKRYAGAYEGDYGWVDDQSTEIPELKARLAACSYRVLRSEVVKYLPKSDRSVVLCEMSTTDARIYRKAEAAMGGAALKAMNDHDDPSAMQALKELSKLTSKSKLPTLMDRLEEHAQRGVKVLVFAQFHETLKAAFAAFSGSTNVGAGGVPAFCAGGWLTSDKRKVEVDAWKAVQGPAVLFANTLSSGVGIDLSDAEVAVFLELTWVPADFQQAEARVQDVHQGKRLTPPIYEYLLVRGTIDEDMGLKLVKKLGVIQQVVGNDSESTNLDITLRESGLVDRNELSLNTDDPEVVQSVIQGLRARLLGDGDDAIALTTSSEAAESDNADAPDVDDEELEEENDNVG